MDTSGLEAGYKGSYRDHRVGSYRTKYGGGHSSSSLLDSKGTANVNSSSTKEVSKTSHVHSSGGSGVVSGSTAVSATHHHDSADDSKVKWSPVLVHDSSKVTEASTTSITKSTSEADKVSSSVGVGLGSSADEASGSEKVQYRIVGRITPTPSPERKTSDSSSKVESSYVSKRHSHKRGGSLQLPEVSRGRTLERVHQHHRPHSSSHVSTSLERRSIRKSHSLSDIHHGRGSVSPSRLAEGEFPVCNRWPNCSVCSIDIQIQSKDNTVHDHMELKEEIEHQALLERKEKEIQLKAETISQITAVLEKTRKELDIRNSEYARRELEIKQLRAELKNCINEKKKVEFSYSEQQINITKYEATETRLIQMTEKYDALYSQNKDLVERVRSLEIAEKEFIELERNVIDLEVALKDFQNVESHRDELYLKLQQVKKQRDEFLEKGKIVESERNEFVKSNKTLEQYLFEWKKKTDTFKRTNAGLKDRILSLERDKKEMEDRIVEIQHERSSMQQRLSQVEMDYQDVVRELKEVTMERNALDQRVAELEALLVDHDLLEEGFHDLRLKLAELARQRDDAELVIPQYKFKLRVLRKTCEEKEASITQLTQELKSLKFAMQHTHYDPVHPPSSGSESVYISHSDYYSGKDPLIVENVSNSNYYNSKEPLILETKPMKDMSHRRRHRRKYVALFDYDPRKSSHSRHPERELRVREGDYVTVYGEVDVNGYLEAEIDGIRGLVPSIYLEETSSDDAISVEIERPVTRPMLTGGGRQFKVLYDYDPFTMGTTDRPDLQHRLRKGEIITIVSDIDADGYYSCMMNGKIALVPSNFIEEYSSSHHYSGGSSYFKESSSHHHHGSSHHHHGSSHGHSTSQFQGTVTLEKDDSVGPPYAPEDLKISKVVTKRAVLLTWELPKMDEYGRSNGALVSGYQIWVNGMEKLEIKSATMSKALVDDVDLEGRVEFSIQTLAENGFRSEKCHFAITGALAALGHDIGAGSGSASGSEYHSHGSKYCALYDYDPFKSSPNPNPSLELALKKGDVIHVTDRSRSDGFYHAEVNGQRGLVPSNFIEKMEGSKYASSSSHHEESSSRRVSFKN